MKSVHDLHKADGRSARLVSLIKPGRDEVTVSFTIPHQFLEDLPVTPPMDCDFNPGRGIDLDVSRGGWNPEDVKRLHPESLAAALMRYAYLVAMIEHFIECEERS